MSPEEREQMNQLCTLIQNEKDPAKISALAKELNTLLEKTERDFVADAKNDPLL